VTYDPVLRVEAAWGCTPFTDVVDADFEELAPNFRGGTWGRGGRPSPIDVYGARQAALEFYDVDRTLDPLNSSSPLNGMLVPDVPIRVIAEYDGDDYPLWFGYVDDYDTLFHVAVGEVTIPSTDALRVLAGITLSGTVYEREVLQDDPVGYWPLNEPSGLVANDRSGNGWNATYNLPDIRRDADGLRDFSGAASFSGAQDSHVRGTYTPLITAYPVSLECIFRFDERSATETRGGLISFVGDDGFQLSFYDSTAGTPAGWIEATVWIGGVGYEVHTPFGLDGMRRVAVGETVHVVAVLEADGGPCWIYINGQLVASTHGSPSFTHLPSRLQFGALGGRDGHASTVSDVAVYDTALSSDRVAAHYAAIRGGWDGDTTGGRIIRILDDIGWPAGLRDIDTGEFVLGPMDFAGKSALDLIRSVVQSEGGRFFQAPDGALTFHDATRAYSETVETTSQITFTDLTSGVTYERGIQFRKSFRDVIDQMTVTREGGTPQTVGATTPVHARTLSTVHRDDRDAHQLAGRIHNRHQTPVTRVGAWSTQPQVDGRSHWVALLTAELGHRVTVDGTPLNTGSPLSIEQNLDSIDFDVKADPGTFRMTFTGQPADPNIGLYFTIGVAGLGIGDGLMR
jgi:hypothetical protein